MANERRVLTADMIPGSFSEAFKIYLLTQNDQINNIDTTANNALNTANIASYGVSTQTLSISSLNNSVSVLQKQATQAVSKTVSTIQEMVGALKADYFDTDNGYKVGDVYVVKDQYTGVTQATGTADINSFNADTTYTVSTVYSQVEVQAIATGLEEARKRILMLETVLRYHGLLGT